MGDRQGHPGTPTVPAVPEPVFAQVSGLPVQGHLQDRLSLLSPGARLLAFQPCPVREGWNMGSWSPSDDVEGQMDQAR